MIQLFFFLKFKSQLRRTRPDIVQQVDEALTSSIIDARGKITGDRFVISAAFNEETIGFWLDMYILIENLKIKIDASSEFFGYSLVISNKTPSSPDLLCRYLANHSGVFINERIAKRFIPYATFEKPSEWLKGTKNRKYGCGSYYRIKELKIFKNKTRNDTDSQNNIAEIFQHKNRKNLILLGSDYSQIRDGLYSYYNNLNKEFPALTIYFGSIGLGSFVDAWSLAIRSLAGTESPAAQTEEIDKLWELLFRERIRDEVSEYIVRCVKRFLLLVFEYYFNIAKRKKKNPVIILENIHLAGNLVTDILLDTFAEFDHEKKNKFIILGIGENDVLSERLQQWESVIIKVLRMTDKNNFYPKLSTELWEIVYAISLFSRFFSPELFQRLFEENDINPVMITRALSILHKLGLIDNPREPRLIGRHLEDHARRVLDYKVSKVKKILLGRLLSWAGRRNLNPCFRLLSIISDLGGANQIDDLLFLKSISSDVLNETISGIIMAMNTGQFEEIVTARAPAIWYIFNTTRALHGGKKEDIEKAFASIHLDNLNISCDPYPVFMTQMLVNLGAYYLGRYEIKEASENAKKAILFGQNKNAYCLPQAYRIFALVCLLKQQTTETIEYLGFALTSAEKNNNYHELAISAYYAAAAQFLYGDVYNAIKLARKSIEQSLGTGCPEWADRSRFLESRIEFDLGNYRQAIGLLEELRKKPYGNKTDEKDSLLAAWIYRCKIYLLEPEVHKPERPNFDADLFEVEASYLNGDYQKAIALCNSLSDRFRKENYLYTEQADWSSGFAQCEHLYFTRGEIQDRMICLFHSLALSHNSEEASEKALQGIQKILHDEKLCEMDPWDAFYFYAKYIILKRNKVNPIDMNTAVSMAFKRLQRRAGRIDDVETCRQYLNMPRWNHELSLAAKEFKLI
ncbi:MAG: hypothetical protein LBQ93_11400 [Treponema sp.]|nr:hypothetical protein [Treponema sp.]